VPIIKTRPTSPGRRFVVKVVHPHLHKGEPYAPLLVAKKRGSGRNNQGRVTMRHQGGASKRHYRLIDFKRDKDGVKGKVERFEYDPNRSAHIALVLYTDGERRYIIAPKNLQIGEEIIAGSDVPIKVGNCLPLENIPDGTVVHCVELKPGKGAQMGRSAGAFVQVVAHEGDYAILRMRSGEVRKSLLTCRATIGEVSNAEHNLCSLGKAGASRHRGIRPTVRGVAMNPVDHPHGGGEGKTASACPPQSPTGVKSKGYRTRKNKRTRSMIVLDRRKK